MGWGAHGAPERVHPESTSPSHCSKCTGCKNPLLAWTLNLHLGLLWTSSEGPASRACLCSWLRVRLDGLGCVECPHTCLWVTSWYRTEPREKVEEGIQGEGEEGSPFLSYYVQLPLMLAAARCFTYTVSFVCHNSMWEKTRSYGENRIRGNYSGLK